MIKTLSFLLALCLLNPCRNQAVANTQSKHEKVFKIVVGDIFDATGELEAEPVRRLSQALIKQKSYSVFRLIWGDSSPNFGSTSTALYNRKAGTLAFYSLTSIGGIGEEDTPNQVQHWKYTGVKPWMIHKIAAKHKNVTASTGDSFFSELSFYRCKQIILYHPKVRHALNAK